MIDIIATFDNAQDALDYEERLLVDGQAHQHPHFLNARAGRLIGRTEAVREKTRTRAIEVSSTPEFKQAKSDMMKRLHAAGAFSFDSIRHEYDGQSLTISEWADKLKTISAQQIRVRLNLGWSFERAITSPVRKRNPNK